LWVICSAKEPHIAEFILHELNIKHWHIGSQYLMVSEEDFQTISNAMYYNIFGRYRLRHSNLLDRFTLMSDGANFPDAMEVSHENVHVVAHYNTKNILYGDKGERLTTLPDPNNVYSITIIYANHENHKPLYAKFSAPTKWLRMTYRGQDLSRIALLIRGSRRVMRRVMRTLTSMRVPFIEAESGVYLYDVNAAFSILRRLSLHTGRLRRGDVEVELTEGPQYGYALSKRLFERKPHF